MSPVDVVVFWIFDFWDIGMKCATKIQFGDLGLIVSSNKFRGIENVILLPLGLCHCLIMFKHPLKVVFLIYRARIVYLHRFVIAVYPRTSIYLKT